jgi:hypothetical protein
MSAFHGQQTTADGVHILVRYSFSTQADMLAGTYTSADDGGLIQVGAAPPYTYYIMKDSTNSANLNLGYVGVASGTGNFNGPAGATAGNAISFADATGNVGSDSGKAAGNIPSSLPVGAAEGGTGQSTLQASMEALSPGIAQTLWVNQNYTGTSNGSVNAPYTTISAALTAIGPASTATQEIENWVVRIAPGFYNEDLVIPQLRTITLASQGMTILSDNTLSTQRSITINQGAAALAAFPKLIKFENIFMTGQLVCSAVAAFASQMELKLSDCNWINSAFAGACMDFTNWELGNELRVFLHSCRLATSGSDLIISNTTYPQADVGLSRATLCDLSGGNITMGGYGHLEACRFGGDHVWKWAGGATSGSNMEDPEGYIGCVWSSPGTATIDAQQAGDFFVDAVSYRGSQGINFAGAGVFTGAPYKGLSIPQYSMGAQWTAVSLDQQNMTKALDRLATAVQGLLGGPIP